MARRNQKVESASSVDVLVVRSTFFIGNTAIRRGQTARAGHPIVKGRESLFRPLVVDFDLPEVEAAPVEAATAAPGEKRTTAFRTPKTPAAEKPQKD